MSAKVHIRDSETPLIEGENLEALCGEVIPKVKFAVVWDEQQMGDEVNLSSLRFCRKCKVKAFSELRYWYGLVPGQESEEA